MKSRCNLHICSTSLEAIAESISRMFFSPLVISIFLYHMQNDSFPQYINNYHLHFHMNLFTVMLVRPELHWWGPYSTMKPWWKGKSFEWKAEEPYAFTFQLPQTKYYAHTVRQNVNCNPLESLDDVFTCVAGKWRIWSIFWGRQYIAPTCTLKDSFQNHELLYGNQKFLVAREVHPSSVAQLTRSVR